MKPYAIIDLHCDTLTAFYDPCRPCNTLDNAQADFSLSQLPRGVRWGQCFAIFVPDQFRGQEAMDYYRLHQQNFQRQMAVFCSRISQCRTAADMETAWAQGKVAAILTVENGSALAGDFAQVAALARDGVRIMTLTWNGENEIGSGNETCHGLSPFGLTLIPRLEEQGILLDVSHLNDQGLDQVFAVATKPFLATHSNARAVCGHRRNLTDGQIQEMVARRCLMGLNFYSPFLRDDGCPATFDDLWLHVEHFLSLGAQDCLALGSDFDGADLSPCFRGPEQSAKLYGYLLDRGLPPAFVDKILFKNALSFFQRNLN